MSLVKSTKVETNKYELEISVGEELFKPAVDQAFHKNAPKINVPGFRKGKAPRAMIEKMYGEGIFFEDAVNALFPAAYEAAVEEAGIEPVDRADVKVDKVDKTGFTFTATVVVKPEVTLGEYKGLAAVKTVVPVTDEHVQDEIQKLVERNARMITVEDRAAEDGDTAVIDFEGFLDGTAFEGGKGEAFPLVLGSNQFIPGFESQVVGHKAGEEFEINVTFPEDYQAEELKGKEAVFKVKINEIKKKELPVVDDEFAKDVSEFDTVDALRADIRKKLEERNEETAQEDVENQLVDGVIQNMQAEIPPVMFEHKIDEMIRDFDYRLQSQGMKLDLYLQYTGTTMEAMRAQMAESAERQVKIRLALEKIVELEGLSASDEDYEAEVKKLSDTYNVPIEQVKSIINEKDVRKDLAVSKAIDLVRDSAKVEEKPLEKKDAQPEQPAQEEKTEEKPAKRTRKSTKKADAE